MRLIVFTQDYVPMAVMDAEDRDLDVLRRFSGDHVQVAMMEPLHIHSWTPVPVRQVAVRVSVEGMRWADGITRPIVVAVGLDSQTIPDGTDLQSLALQFMHEAIRAARRRDPTYREPPRPRLEGVTSAGWGVAWSSVEAGANAAQVANQTGTAIAELARNESLVERVNRNIRARLAVSSSFADTYAPVTPPEPTPE